MKKILFTANLDSFFIKFLIPQLKYFKDNGYVVHVAARSEEVEIPYCDKKFNVNFSRGFNLSDNRESYNQMKKILIDNHYDIISCHTPFGGAIPRLAAKNLNIKDTKIIYFAHGFHFYKGAPIKNWLIYYTAEKYLSKYTSSIITINKEDYNIAKKKMLDNVTLVSGVGISREKFDVKLTTREKRNLYKSLHISINSYILIFSGEINKNKNQWLLLDAVKILKDRIPNLILLLPGTDLTNGEIETYAKKIGVYQNVRFLGFRKDIPELLLISNLSLSSSKREGLPVNIIEAMYMNVPVIATNCRGNRDLIKNGVNGLLVYKNSPKEFANKIERLYKHPELARKFSDESKKNVEKYMIDNVLNDVVRVYEE